MPSRLLIVTYLDRSIVKEKWYRVGPLLGVLADFAEKSVDERQVTNEIDRW